MDPNEISNKHDFNPKNVAPHVKFINKGNVFPRSDKKNPWHLVDLQSFIVAFTKYKKSIMSDPHFTVRFGKNKILTKNLIFEENLYF